MAECLSPGPCSFALRRKKLVTVTILSQTPRVTFATFKLNDWEDGQTCPQEASTAQIVAHGSGRAPRNGREILMRRLGLALI